MKTTTYCITWYRITSGGNMPESVGDFTSRPEAERALSSLCGRADCASAGIKKQIEDDGEDE